MNFQTPPALFLAASALVVLLMVSPARAASEELLVGGAASAGAVLEDLAAAFGKGKPEAKISFTLAASGALLAQLSQGAPIGAFLFADGETLEQARGKGLVAGEAVPVAENRLVLAVPAGRRDPPKTLEELTGPKVRLLCVGDPGTVPLGRYAKRALEAAGLWAALQPKLLLASSATQARQYLGGGDVDAALLYATDANALGARAEVALVLSGERPVYYAGVVRDRPNQEALARAFVAFLASPEGQGVFARHGFPARGNEGK